MSDPAPKPGPTPESESESADSVSSALRRTLPRLALRGALGLAIGAGALYLAFRNVSPGALKEALASARWPWLLVSVLLTLVLFRLRAWRWQLMLADVAEPAPAATYRAFMLGALGNVTLPGRLGDLVRTVLMGRHRPSLGAAGALSSIALEKVLDGTVLLGLFGVVVLVAPVPDVIRQGALVAAAAFAAAFVLLLFLSHGHLADYARQRAERHRFWALLSGVLGQIADGLHGLKQGRRLLTLIGLTLLVWGLETGVVGACLLALGLDLPPEAALLSLVLLSLATMIPGAPGFIGTYQLVLILALGVYGVARETALATGLVLNALVIATTVLAGLAVVWRGDRTAPRGERQKAHRSSGGR